MRPFVRTIESLKIEFDEGLNVIENWNDKPFNLLYSMYPLMKSAYDLLVSGSLNRLKECPHCGWLYLDTSKNSSRKWCNMKTCGNTVKTGKYYYRKKQQISDN